MAEEKSTGRDSKGGYRGANGVRTSYVGRNGRANGVRTTTAWQVSRTIFANRNIVRTLLIAAVVLMILLLPVPWKAVTPAERRIRIEAGMYNYSPAQISANPGDSVTIELVSTDVVHGFSLDGYGVQIQADPGQTETVTFIAGKPGVFRFRCSSPCGNLHPFMIGTLRVGPNVFLLRGAALGLLAITAGLVWRTRRSSRETAPGAIKIADRQE